VPDKVITAAAHELDADLVVVGHHQGLGGGVPEQIVGGLGCAVLVVQSGAEVAGIERAVANQA
jgi:nucleotide-binding universal stress UspA family protein